MFKITNTLIHVQKVMKCNTTAFTF